MARLIKVALVDDHELVRLGIRSLLDGIVDIEVVGEAENGELAMRLVREKKPDVILMDIRMPGIGGLEATRKLQMAQPNIRVIALTSCEEDPFPSRLLQAGAVGYLTKGCSTEEMVLAIRRVYSGQRYISPKIAEQLAFKHLSEAEEGSPFDILSERELQVMMMLTRGYKVQEIAKAMTLSPKTVNTYRYRLFEKLKINGDVELMHLAMRYKMLDEES